MTARQNIIKMIGLAQVASDSGKGYLCPLNVNHGFASKHKYTAKDKYVQDAIKALDHMPKCNIRYYICRKENEIDVRGESFSSYIVYFEIYEKRYGGDGRMTTYKYQVSFHIPHFSINAEQDAFYKNHLGRKEIVWNGVIGGSKENSYDLLQMLRDGKINP